MRYFIEQINGLWCVEDTNRSPVRGWPGYPTSELADAAVANVKACRVAVALSIENSRGFDLSGLD